MPTPNIHRSLGISAEDLPINRFWTGEITNRTPTFTPLSQMGFQVIQRLDALWKGCSNMEISPQMTLVRRYGFSKFSSAAFGSSDWPLTFSSFKNTSGTIKLMVDTPTEVASFTTGAITQLYVKGTTTQSSFQKVGDTLYVCDGTNLKKWDGTNLTTWGITAPVTAPTVAFDGSAGSVTWLSGCTYVYAFKNSTSGHYSTASPISGNLLAGALKKIDLTGSRSTDAQVDKIAIFRTQDGGPLYYKVTEIANPPSGSWSYTDNNLDSALNTDIVAAIAHANDPPPTGLGLVTWHQDRLVAASSNILYFSAGPDSTLGVPEECWPPANLFKLPDKITALVSTTQGLVVFTASDMYAMFGTDTASFWVRPVKKNFGIQSQNCVVQDGDVLFIYTSKRQLFQIDSNGENEIGQPIGDQLLSTFNPTLAYLALHRSGTDAALWISDGSTKVKGYSLQFQSWYPTATVTGGVTAIKSIETSTSTYQLLMGRTAGSGNILARDTTLYTDDGTSYTCVGVVGSLVPSPLGQSSKIEHVFVQAIPVGTYPTVSVLLNEISGTFVALPNPVDSPALLAGSAYASKTVWQRRHDLANAQQPLPRAQVAHLQIQFSFIAENTRAEIVGMAIE